MKKVLSMLLVLALLFGTTLPASAAVKKSSKTDPVVESSVKSAIIKNFTENSITLIGAGKTYVLPIDSKTKIIKKGESTTILDSAKKGLPVKYRALLKSGVPTTLTYIEFPGVGSAYEGLPGIGLSNELTTVYLYEDTNLTKKEDKTVTSVTKNVNNMVEIAQSSIVKDYLADNDTFTMADNKTIFIGNYPLILESVKVSLSGKDLNVINDKAIFDTAKADDEVQLIRDAKTLEYKLILEAHLTDEQLKEADNIVKVYYQAKQYDIKKVELLGLVINEDVYTELNGITVSSAKALYRGNYMEALTNEKNEIIFINAYYRDLPATVYGISGNRITFTGYKNGNPAFTETFVINAGCSITNASGSDISLSSLKVGDSIKVSTSPDLNYQVFSIIKN